MQRSSCSGMLRLALALCLAATMQCSADKGKKMWSPENMMKMGIALTEAWRRLRPGKQDNKGDSNTDNANYYYNKHYSNNYYNNYNNHYYYNNYYDDARDDPASCPVCADSLSEFLKSAWPKNSAQKTADVYGDPRVCCAWNREKEVFEEFDVKGAFSTLCLHSNGTARAVEFIGVDEKDHVSEIRHFELSSLSWKYKDIRSTIGTSSNRHEFCEDAWSSVPKSAHLPPDEWFQPFQQGRSFFVWQDAPHSSIEGPKGEFLTNLFSLNGTVSMVQMINDGTFAGDDVGEVVKSTLRVLQFDSGEDPDLRQKFASDVAVASMVMAFKGRASPAGF